MNKKLKIGDLVCFDENKFINAKNNNQLTFGDYSLRTKFGCVEFGINDGYIFLVTDVYKTITGNHQYKLQTFNKAVEDNFSMFFMLSDQTNYIKKIT